MIKIGILGSGIVAKTLATGFLKKGYRQVKVGSGHLEKIANWPAELGGDLTLGTFQDTARDSDLLVLAVKGSAAMKVLEAAGDAAVDGKVIIDTCNPIADRAPDDGVLSFFTEKETSLMEMLQGRFKGAKLVKAFSCIGSALMVDPDFGGEKPTMFSCGDDLTAKSEVRHIVERFGFEWADMGGAKAARAIEPLCILWCIPGFKDNRWNHAFRMMVP